MQLKQKRAEFEQMRGENRTKDEENRQILQKTNLKKVNVEKERF